MKALHPEKTPLESWISKKINSGSEVLTQKQLAAYQLAKLNGTLEYVQKNSRFYQRHLREADCRLASLTDLERLPLTTADDLRDSGQEMICVKPGEIQRIVTLQTSGTTGLPKRVFFTEEDQELTIDFFHHGMLTMVKPGDRVLVLLPGKAPGSVGELLQRGLARAGAEGLVHGPVADPQTALAQMIRDRVNVVVGIPTQVLALVRLSKSRRLNPFPPLHSVLLTTDHVPNSIVRELVKVWDCQVFNHYGMTEMGLGGGVDCQSFDGYHLREVDLFFEIIDPLTGCPVPEGQMGEVVFTTLTRTGMPLIRYRTGDYSRFIPQVCSCGTILRRLARIRSRDRVLLGPDQVLSIADLDEALFALDEVLDFRAVLATEQGKPVLSLEVYWSGDLPGGNISDGAASEEAIPETARQQISQAIKELPMIKSAISSDLQLNLTVKKNSPACGGNGTGKRTIIDQRG